ncbi:MAG: heavy-metal-associated domain-containing protein [Kiritimatiellae bacterium]|nr:heavy-metal-associated domain-containing protein [Kiritimatiellia bacterium]
MSEKRMMAGRWTRVLAAGLAAAVLTGSGCFREVMSEVTLKVPEMKTEAQARAVEKALREVGKSGQGQYVTEVAADAAAGTVRVKYNNVELGLMNLKTALKHVGFEAE